MLGAFIFFRSKQQLTAKKTLLTAFFFSPKPQLKAKINVRCFNRIFFSLRATIDGKKGAFNSIFLWPKAAIDSKKKTLLTAFSFPKAAIEGENQC
jgi:hypothetical protein